MSRRVEIFKLLKKTSSQFLDDNAIKLSAALSYYTIFAMAPLLIMIMTLVNFFYGPDAIQGKVYGEINGLVGNAAARGIQDIIKQIQEANHTAAGAIIALIILILAATGVFTEIQDSINYIWCIKSKPKKGWLKLIINRLLSFSLIISLGFILMVSLMANAVMDLLSDHLKYLFADATIQIFYILNLGLIFLVTATIFTVIFKVLPDATIRWKDSLIGALFTASLFVLGKFVISYYLAFSQIDVTYGAAASVIIMLLWVYYSSIILFFGAEFTHVYATHYGGGVVPYNTAVFIIKQEAKEINHAPL